MNDQLLEVNYIKELQQSAIYMMEENTLKVSSYDYSGVVFGSGKNLDCKI